MSKIHVLNSRGEKEPFSFQKVYRSARRVGASSSLAKEIAGIIELEASPGITTSDIFRKVERLLLKKDPKPGLKFSLKKAMLKLGPTGFPFEKYIGEVFSRMGFKVKLNQEIPGFCCHFYEIDFLAEKGNLIYIGECKYRHLAGGKVHSDTALSNYARFLDIKKGKALDGIKKSRLKSLLVTNAKFTTKAKDYSRCVGVEILGWNYPPGKGLEYLIESKKLYPITALPSLKKYLADIFVQRKMMLAEDILKIDTKRFAKKTGISSNRFEALVREARTLLE
jgi:hypothetical protein